MKALLVGLFAVTLSTTARAASTDTIDIPRVLDTPAEQKVVELHMSVSKSPALEETKRKRKAETLPFPGHGICSGAFIDATGDVITARHCIDGFDSFEVVTFDRRRYTAVVLATSTLHDLAIVHIDRRNTPFFELADEVNRGETIFVLGSPLGVTDTLSTGIVARLDGDITFVDCSALPGNSGGPVFDAEQKLVGIMTAGFVVLFGTTHLNMMQSLDALHYFITKTLEKNRGHE